MCAWAMRFNSPSPSSFDGSISEPSCHSLKELIIIIGGTNFAVPATQTQTQTQTETETETQRHRHRH